MKTVFLDTKVVVDLLQKREGFYQYSAQIFSLGFENKLQLFVSPITFSTASFLLRKLGTEAIKNVLKDLRLIVDVVEMDYDVIDNSLISNFNDIEDAMQYYCAKKCHADVIVTRNIKDFSESEINVLSPDAFLAEYE